MAINFELPRILSYSAQNDFAGDVFRYASKRNLVIEGSFLDNQVSGVAPIWEQIAQMDLEADNYEPILLNGINFGSGRINSIQFKEGADVLRKDYTANITVFDTGNLFNMTGPYYAGLDLGNPDYPVHLVENFGETFDFAITEDGTYRYRQNINVKFLSGKLAGNNKSAIEMAKGFASGLLFSTPAFGFIDTAHSGFYNVDGVRTFTESYNLITNECTFSENFELPGALSGNCSVKYAHELATDQYGSTTVTEHGSIKGINPDFYLNAESGYAIQQPLIFGRCEEALNFYEPSGFPLNNSHLNSHKKVNKILGEIGYSITFTNNPAFNPLYVWEYTSSIDRDSTHCFYKVSEEGRIRGLDDCQNIHKNDNALAAFELARTGIIPRIQAFYLSSTTLTNPLKAISLVKKDSPLIGQIEYGYVFTDDLTLSIAPGIKRLDYSITDSRPVTKYNKFNVIGVAEIAQSARIATQGIFGLRVSVIGERGTLIGPCLEQAKTIARANLPTGDFKGTYYLSDCNYSFVPYESNLTFNIAWKYYGDVLDASTP